MNDANIKENIKIIEYSKNMKDEIGINQFEEELSYNYEIKTNLEKQNINLKIEVNKENERLDEIIKDKNITDLYSMVDKLKIVENNPNFKKKYPRRTKKQNFKFVKDMFNFQNRFYSTSTSTTTDNSKNNINFNQNRVSERCIRNSNSYGLNQIITEITTNPMYVKISQILKSEVEPTIGEALNNRDKQIQIEETLRFFWNQELSKVFEGKKSLFSNSIGINILMNSISKLEKVLNTIKEDKRYLKNKKYRYHIMLSENGIIVSIVLSNIIPHMMKFKSNQNTATLFKRIGKELHSNLLNNEWNKYDNNEKATLTQKNYYVEQNKNKYEIEKGLSKEEFNIRLDEILGIISSDDYFKLGCDLAEIVSENSNLFNFMNVPNEDNTVQRIIVPGAKLEDQIVKLLAVDTEKLVMICEPCK